MCANNIKLLFYWLIAATHVIVCSAPPLPRSIHHKRNSRHLYNSVPRYLRNKVTYYKALLEQAPEDQHSCGQRTLFHALALKEGLQRMRENIPLSASLRSLLSNEKLYWKTYHRVNRDIRTENPGYDFTEGTCGKQLVHAGNTFAQLKDNVVPLYFENNQLKTLMDNSEIMNEEDLEDPYTTVRNSEKFRTQTDKLQHPLDSIHFPILIDEHWVLASIMLNYAGKARLIVMDSCNSWKREYQRAIKILNKEVEKLNGELV